MTYFDTSFLTPLFRQEQSSPRVGRFIAGRPAGQLAISLWTVVEFASVLARDVRMGVIGEEQARATEGLFREVVEETFHVLLPGAEDFALAGRYVQRYETGLRAGDALHLAIAAGHRAEAIYSLDRGMVRAGEMLGLPVRLGI